MSDFSLLYVEDDMLTQKIMKSVLSGYFKDIYVANNGLDGIELYKDKRPDIILTDISMPKMDGLEMSEQIRALNAKQPIILFTAYGEKEHLSTAIKLSIDKYVMKPLDSKQMFKILDEVVLELSKEREAKAYKKNLEFSSNHDLLTGLGNRKYFFSNLRALEKESRKKGKTLAILSMDLNRFKPINDTYGHDAGDFILKKVAAYLKKSLRKSDIISRFGGDEFVIAIGGLKEHNHILNFLERLERNFLEPMVYRDDDGIEHRLVISFSMGITFCDCHRAVSFDTHLREADKAMYAAKEQKIPYAFFNPNEESKFKIKARKSNELKKAIDRGEFLLYYQPIINLKSNEIVGLESLLRWNSPKEGLLTPDKFLSYIWDDLEIGTYLGAWVIESVFMQYESWLKREKVLTLSINISLKELHSRKFLSSIKNLLKKYLKVNSNNISFEVDEATAIKDIELNVSVLKELKSMGFKISLDDFGTGKSTLSLLNRLNIDTIKIDKSFVIDMLEDGENHSMVDASIKLAKAFNYKVIAIGVESQEHLPTLLKLGCDKAQGYGISQPLPASEILTLIEKK
jgi:diguanylate cyclase (GGDEF)-like protein